MTLALNPHSPASALGIPAPQSEPAPVRLDTPAPPPRKDFLRSLWQQWRVTLIACLLLLVALGAALRAALGDTEVATSLSNPTSGLDAAVQVLASAAPLQTASVETPAQIAMPPDDGVLPSSAHPLHSDLPPAVLPTPLVKRGVDTRESLRRPKLGAGNPARLRVPDRIEGASGVDGKADPLAPLVVDAQLRMASAASAPLRLVATRAVPAPGMAQLEFEGRPPGHAHDRRWFYAGELTPEGWKLVEVTSRGVVLLDPSGNPVQLTLQGPGAANLPTGPATTSPIQER